MEILAGKDGVKCRKEEFFGEEMGLYTPLEPRGLNSSLLRSDLRLGRFSDRSNRQRCGLVVRLGCVAAKITEF
jgi:hypothetical protein